MRVAVTAVFALNGALFASIFARLPAIREDLGLGEGRLGLALACSMAGLLVSQPLAGALSTRIGSRPLVVLGAAGYALALLLVGAAGSFGALAGAFLAVGLLNGVLDVSMNLNGLAVERRLGRPVLSTLHAAFSFGALAGAAAGSALAGAGVGVQAHLAGAAAAGLLVVAVAAPRLARDAPAPPGERPPAFARPTRALASLGALAFCVLLAEGAVNDWAAVFLADEAGATDAVAGAGLAVFSAAMGFGRLAGDRAALLLGERRLVLGGALLAAAGLGVALATAAAAPVLAGLVVLGLGLAALFPVALRGAGDGPSVAAVSTVGYVAFLAGPPLIGGLAELVGLRAALLLPLGLLLVAAALSPAAAPARSSRPGGRRPARTPA